MKGKKGREKAGKNISFFLDGKVESINFNAPKVKRLSGAKATEG